MKRANVPYTMEVLPWNRAYMRAQAEKDTCLFATARLDNREKLFIWVGPLANNLWAVYGRGDFAGTVRQLPDLKPYRIGGVVNDAKVEYLKENGVTQHQAGAGGPPQSAAALPAGRGPESDRPLGDRASTARATWRTPPR